MAIVLFVLLTAVVLAAQWRLFQKMGYEGWKSVIPVYSLYLKFKAIYGSAKLLILAILAPVIAPLPVAVLMAIATMLIENRLAIIGVPLMLVAVLLMVAIMLLPMIIMIKVNFDMARAFHKGRAFGFGLWLCGPVMTVVLAFSNAVFREGVAMVRGDDIISCTIDKVDAWIRGGRKTSAADAAQALTILRELHEKGDIDDAVYQARQQAILQRL